MGSKTCLLLATKLEAKPILKSVEFDSPQVMGPLEIYSSSKLDVAIIGIGPIRASVSVGFLASKNYTCWINLGVAGALKDNYRFKDIVEVGTCYSRDDVHPFDRSCDEIGFQQKGSSLITVGEAIHDDEQKQTLGKRADLVDMEGYAIALAAVKFSIDLKMLKVISDDASSDSSENVVKNIPECMQKLWNKVEFDYFK